MSEPLTTTELGLRVPIPPAEEWREHTAARFRETDPNGYEFALYLVRELGVTTKAKLTDLVSDHRKARGLEGISRNTIIALMNDPSVFKKAEIEDIIQRRSLLTAADALEKVEELLTAAKSAKDLGAAAMALTSVYNVKQLSSGGATRINGSTQDASKAKGFDHFMQMAAQKLQQQPPPQSAPELPASHERVLVVDAVEVNDQTDPRP